MPGGRGRRAGFSPGQRTKPRGEAVRACHRWSAKALSFTLRKSRFTTATCLRETLAAQTARAGGIMGRAHHPSIVQALLKAGHGWQLAVGILIGADEGKDFRSEHGSRCRARSDVCRHADQACICLRR